MKSAATHTSTVTMANVVTAEGNWKARLGLVLSDAGGVVVVTGAPRQRFRTRGLRRRRPREAARTLPAWRCIYDEVRPADRSHPNMIVRCPFVTVRLRRSLG